MGKSFKVALRLDYRGIPCQMSVLQISSKIKTVPLAAIIEVISNDPRALTTLQAWARTTGHKIVDMQTGIGQIRFFIKRVV
ncbi:MAG: sulfurtransferase TusA family protein [Syntrophomonadaceae bacterium]|nr:sulfurtransferase TusA family protein [Syntrophomonadaceae bacterium]